MLAALTGAVAGVAMGYVLQRGQMCFHSMFANAWEGQRRLLRAWLLAVAFASVGLSIIYLSPLSKGLNTGLGFAPVADLVGGAVFGVGMLVASSCASGLFYKLGSGMLGALVGIVGWIGGEAAVRRMHVPGPVVLEGGSAATFAGVTHIPRLLLSVAFLVVVTAGLWRWRRPSDSAQSPWQWDWSTLGIALGVVTVAGWLLARAGQASFGPSTVGATSSVLSRHPNWWLIAFLIGIVTGSIVAARTAGGFSTRGETPLRYGRLALGGFLLGAGGWIAGGCNLGHGLSGVAQLNVSSWVVVATMATTIGVGRAVALRVSAPPGVSAPDHGVRAAHPA